MTVRTDSDLRPGASVDPATLLGERWFAAPAKPIRSIVVEERFDFPRGGALAILRVEVEGGRLLWRTMPIESPDGRSPWVDILELAMRGGEVTDSGGSSLRGDPPPQPRLPPGLTVAPLGKDQSHTSVIVDNALVLKVYRALRPGTNPEVELGAALALDPDAPLPAYRGAVLMRLNVLRPGLRHAFVPIAFVQDLVPDAGDPFEELADQLAAWLRAGAPQRSLSGLVTDAAPAGVATAALHASLARVRGRAFAPRDARADDVGRWRRRAAKAHRSTINLLRSAHPAHAAWLGARQEDIVRALEPLGSLEGQPLQRIHADLHLGQLLRSGDRFLIADLEGEPTQPIAERRRLDTPLRDLASMLRSFDHVARSGMRRSGVAIEEVAVGTSAAEEAIEALLATVRLEFLAAYEHEAAARGLTVRLHPALLHALEVEKELYEFAYAATYLPTWMYAPSAGMRWLLEQSAA